MPSETTTDSTTTESQNTACSPSPSSTQDLASSFDESPVHPCEKEIQTLLRHLLELNAHCYDTKINPDGKYEDETQVRAALSLVGASYYALHHRIFDLVPWDSFRRRHRLNPQLYPTPGTTPSRPLGRPKSEGDQPTMSRDELDSVLKKLGL